MVSWSQLPWETNALSPSPLSPLPSPLPCLPDDSLAGESAWWSILLAASFPELASGTAWNPWPWAPSWPCRGRWIECGPPWVLLGLNQTSTGWEGNQKRNQAKVWLSSSIVCFFVARENGLFASSRALPGRPMPENSLWSEPSLQWGLHFLWDVCNLSQRSLAFRAEAEKEGERGEMAAGLSLTFSRSKQAINIKRVLGEEDHSDYSRMPVVCLISLHSLTLWLLKSVAVQCLGKNNSSRKPPFINCHTLYTYDFISLR